MMWGWDGGFGFGWMWLMMGAMILFGVLTVAGVGALIAWVSAAAARGGRAGTGEGERAEDRAVDEARRRYAAGEITKEELEDILRTLRR